MVVVTGAEPLEPKTATGRVLSALVIDRQPLFLAAMRSLMTCPPLSAAVEVMTRSGSLEWLGDSKIDLVVCELRSEPIGGVELVDLLARRGVPTPVILLGDPGDEPLLLEGFRLGAAGLFMKDSPVEHFVRGLVAVAEGNRAMAPNIVGFLMATNRMAGIRSRSRASAIN
jgi:DNA-binding NarL/FixJ family response regulator